MHGDEAESYLVANRSKGWPLKKGKLVAEDGAKLVIGSTLRGPSAA